MSNILKQTFVFGFAATIAILSVAIAPARAGTILVYASGHSDLCADYEDGSLALHYHFHTESPGLDENGDPLLGEISPSALYTRVSDETKIAASGGSAYGFLGTPAGSDVWVLSQNHEIGQPYLGFGTEELDYDDWSTGIDYTLISVNGPGEFSMWMSPPFGDPIVYWATSDGIVDGDGYTDVYTQAALSHSHANWGFTAEGVYQVQMQVSGTLADGTTSVSSDVETFTFLVGSSTVPEPGTIALLASGAAAMMLGFWRRRGNKIMQS